MDVLCGYLFSFFALNQWLLARTILQIILGKYRVLVSVVIDTVLKNYDRYSEYFEGCKYSYDVFKDETKCDCFKYLMMQKVFFHEYEEYTPILYGIYRDCDREFIENLKKIVMTRDDSEEFNDRTFFPSFSDLEIFKELKLF